MAVRDILISRDGLVMIDGEFLNQSEKHELALRDGFTQGFEQMLHFWLREHFEKPQSGNTFGGRIYHWGRP